MSSNITSPFLQLPAELRVRVYAIFIASSCAALMDGASGKEAGLTNLLRICQQIRGEAYAEVMKTLPPLESELQSARREARMRLATFKSNHMKWAVSRRMNAIPIQPETDARLIVAKGTLDAASEALRMVQVLKAVYKERLFDVESGASMGGAT